MKAWFVELNRVVQALLAAMFTWGVTALGAGLVFLAKHPGRKVMDGMLGMAAGAMIYVVIEELIPESQSNKEAGDAATIGAMLGFAVMMTLDVALA
jgi:ZIP family zinc transporter